MYIIEPYGNAEISPPVAKKLVHGSNGLFIECSKKGRNHFDWYIGLVKTIKNILIKIPVINNGCLCKEYNSLDSLSEYGLIALFENFSNITIFLI